MSVSNGSIPPGNLGLDEAEYGINSLSRLGFKGRDKSTAKKIENEFKKFYKLVDKFEREAEVDKF